MTIVAGGTGIASVYELAARLAGSHPVEVLFGARTASDLMAVEDFEALKIPLRVATEDGSAGVRGVVTDLLESALEGPTVGANLPEIRASRLCLWSHGDDATLCGNRVPARSALHCGARVVRWPVGSEYASVARPLCKKEDTL